MYSKEKIQEDLKEDLMRARTAVYMDEMKKELERQRSMPVIKGNKFDLMDHPMIMAFTITGVCTVLFSILS